jgi:hypothetical protein
MFVLSTVITYHTDHITPTNGILYYMFSKENYILIYNHSTTTAKTTTTTGMTIIKYWQ